MSAPLRRWRHDLHRIPELGLREHRTGDYLAAELAALGLDVVRGVGGTGLVATLRGRGPGRAIGLRADMDGLPLHERGDRPYRSEHDGVMHACGHDGHMAMLLGAAHVLATEGGFDGTVHLIFQPAEEHGLGARAMIADGLFERFPVEAIYGVHNMPGQPAGSFGTRPGPLMAGEDNFEIRIAGRGGHAARPQMVVDPIVIAAELVLALQTIVARSIDPASPAVVSCTEITTDGARNAIPGEAVIRGDTRSFDVQVSALIERRMRELAAGISAAHGASASVSYTRSFEPTVNTAREAAAALCAARAVTDQVDGEVAPWTASEDFGVFLRAVPGCFALLGTGDGPSLHSPEYDFNDDVLDLGVRYYVNLVRA
ncbi:M20 aminoacylase family protein [Dactylosporangium sp. CA-139066]|uniref:M20 aminoacylase family protein n=1 Tax=Dactylosporangium sp. CA-139066 TaxID=3239930 RepID=UPI003D92299B